MTQSRRTFLLQAGSVGLGLAAARCAAGQAGPDGPRKGLALVVGLNRLDPDSYAGWDGALHGPEIDVETMSEILGEAGFAVRTLRSSEAHREAFWAAALEAARAMRDGDIFALYFSGIASQLPDANDEEPDGLDETLCLFDGQFLDDDFARLWHEFPAGARILSILDCSYAGSLLGNANADAQGRLPSPTPAPEALKGELANRIYQERKEEYDRMRQRPHPGTDISASVLALAGAQPGQAAQQTPFGGVFTRRLQHVWAQGQFQGNYRQFFDKIAKLMERTGQTPVYRTFGVPNPDFEAQRPFTI